MFSYILAIHKTYSPYSSNEFNEGHTLYASHFLRINHLFSCSVAHQYPFFDKSVQLF